MRSLISALVAGVLLYQHPLIAQTDRTEAEKTNLSMAGALINNWCESNWQDQDYITIYACNYHLAQGYNLELSAADFERCALSNGGDIVGIADCMVVRFNAWVAETMIE